MQESYDNGDGTQLQSYMDANRMWMPLMLFSGIIDMMFFTSMMSFMGLRINPMESAIIGSDSGHHDTGAFMTRVQHQVVIVTLVTDLVRIPVVLMDLMVVVLIVSKMLCHETVTSGQGGETLTSRNTLV